jgi:hypothetical protein
VKFALAWLLVLTGMTVWLWTRGMISADGSYGMLALLLLTLLVCLSRRRWLRQPYRLGMSAGYFVGQVIGRFLLLLFFLAVLTPLGLLLRLIGKDLLGLKKKTTTYWHPPRATDRLDRLF